MSEPTTLQRALEDPNTFAVTAEVGPPKGTDVSKMLGHVELLAGKVHALNVTDNQSSVMRISSLAACALIRRAGVEPVLQVTCRDRNRLGLQSDLLGASVLDVHNVLTLTGDHVTLGDHPQGKPVFDLDSVQLLQAITALNQGSDFAGNALNAPTRFYPGAAVAPEADPIEPQLMKFVKKIEIGARFFQTQAVYDLDNFKRFMDFARRYDVKIMAGVLLLKSAAMARFMNEKIPGVYVPDNVIAEMAEAEKGKGLSAGIRIAARFIRALAEEKICDGVHVMAIGKEDAVPRILEEAGLV